MPNTENFYSLTRQAWELSSPGERLATVLRLGGSALLAADTGLLLGLTTKGYNGNAILAPLIGYGSYRISESAAEKMRAIVRSRSKTD